MNLEKLKIQDIQCFDIKRYVFVDIENEFFKELVKSIKDIGQIMAIDVVKRGNKYLVINGYRRFIACKHLKMKVILCNVYEGTDKEIKNTFNY